MTDEFEKCEKHGVNICAPCEHNSAPLYKNPFSQYKAEKRREERLKKWRVVSLYNIEIHLSKLVEIELNKMGKNFYDVLRENEKQLNDRMSLKANQEWVNKERVREILSKYATEEYEA